jgi:hypothetical protein
MHTFFIQLPFSWKSLSLIWALYNIFVWPLVTEIKVIRRGSVQTKKFWKNMSSLRDQICELSVKKKKKKKNHLWLVSRYSRFSPTKNILIIMTVVRISIDVTLASVLLLWSEMCHNKLRWKLSIPLFFLYIFHPFFCHKLIRFYFSSEDAICVSVAGALNSVTGQ